MTRLLIAVFFLLPALVDPLCAQGDAASIATLESELREAEAAFARDEPRLAESHYRAALREGWYLLGLIEAAEGDLDEARRALSRARNAAAVDLARARVALALVELRLGEVEAPLRELRYVVEERPGDTELLRRFLQALRATGREEELAAELERLRELGGAPDAEAPAPEQRAQELPALDLGSLASESPERIEDLRGRLEATLARVYRNLARLKERTGFTRGIEALRAAGAELAAGSSAEPFGGLDLDAAEGGPRVAPIEVSPAELVAIVPPALHGALAHLDEGDLEAAGAELRGQLEGPHAAAARALLGIVLAAQGQVEVAERELLRAVAEGPHAAHQALAHRALARLYWHAGGEEEGRSGAIEQLRRAAELGSLDRDLALVLAEAEAATGRRRAAREQLRSLDKRYGSVEALLRLSALSAQLGEEKVAFGEAQRALEKAPSSEEVLLAHTRTALEVGVVHSAALSVEPLVRMHPEVAEYHYLLGRTWRERRQMGEASEAFLKAVTLDSGFLSAYLSLGLALNHESRFEEAREYLGRYLEAHPEDRDARAGLAEAEERLGEASAAERRALEVLAEDPRHPRAQLVVGLVHMGRGELAAAREALERAAEADPLLAKAHYQLSLACGRLGDRECAQEHLELYKKALEGPESTFVQLELESGSGAAERTMKKQGS